MLLCFLLPTISAVLPAPSLICCIPHRLPVSLGTPILQITNAWASKCSLFPPQDNVGASRTVQYRQWLGSSEANTCWLSQGPAHLPTLRVWRQAYIKESFTQRSLWTPTSSQTPSYNLLCTEIWWTSSTSPKAPSSCHSMIQKRVNIDSLNQCDGGYCINHLGQTPGSPHSKKDVQIYTLTLMVLTNQIKPNSTLRWGKLHSSLETLTLPGKWTHLGLFSCDAVNSKTTLGIIHKSEVLTGLLNADDIWF